MATEHHIPFMQRALFLASLGLGKSSPLFLAGGAVVLNQKIIAEGWVQKNTSIHFIPYLLAKVSNESLLKGSLLYVSTLTDTDLLAHIDLLATHSIGGIVIANLIATDIKRSDLLDKLHERKIKATLGVLEQDEEALNFRFYYARKHRMPYVILKWAETADGYIARENYDSKWISNALSRKIVHKWRAEEDSILVGSNTGHYDNPQLNVRNWEGRDPIRIVIDRQLRLPQNLCLFDRTQPTLCYNLKKNHKEANLEFVNLSDTISEKVSFFQALLADLFQRDIHSVIVEGGSVILQQFIQEGLWNEARIFKSSNAIFKKGIEAPLLSEAMLCSTGFYLTDKLFIYKNNLKTE